MPLDIESAPNDMSRAGRIRWSPVARHDAAMRKIELAITKSQRGLHGVVFTKEDRAHVVALMGGKLKVKTPAAETLASVTDTTDTTADDESAAV